MNNTEICKEYGELEIKNNISIKKEDLPGEFGDNAFETINEFIKKTHHLNHEWVMYFDYNTGEILKCGKGENNKVKIDFKDGEFDNFNVASIHNHPQNVFSPPSGKNFKIMEREFEDYELIVGFEYFGF
ncbi:MAG: hypothetical protein IJ122_04165 [Methanobrevibacter sp.]|nr:hypothetical protein [Methanobrevibacter sp.]